MRIMVTGGAGFIGSNLLNNLHKQYGQKLEVILVEDLEKSVNKITKRIPSVNIIDILDYTDWAQIKFWIEMVSCVIHLGADSSTSSDATIIFEKNYSFSKALFKIHQESSNYNKPFIYASSAGVYGNTKDFTERNGPDLNPLTPYAYYKLAFDRYVFERFEPTKCYGLRLFNVYGPGEEFKNPNQVNPFMTCARGGQYIYFGDDGFGGKAENHSRDFIYIDDVVDIIKWFMETKPKAGIYNVGTGVSSTFLQVVNSFLIPNIYAELPFPEKLKGKTQYFTKADISKLKTAGYSKEFISIKDGAAKCLDYAQSIS